MVGHTRLPSTSSPKTTEPIVETRRQDTTPTLTVADGSLAGVPTGVWQIDPMHSSVMFSVRHLMSRVRGRFTDVDGAITIGAEDYAVAAMIGVGSVDTGTPMRDEHLKSNQFFDADAHPTMRFVSSGVEDHGDGTALIVGELTIHGTTHTIRLEADLLGLDETGLQGEPRVGFSARTTVRRSDFGVGEGAVEGSKVVVGDAVIVELDIEAYLNASGAATGRT